MCDCWIWRNTRIKVLNEYGKFHTGTQPQANYFLIPIRNEQGHRDMKYNRNMKENIMYIDMYLCKLVIWWWYGSECQRKCRIIVTDDNEKKLNWDLGYYILFYTKQKYCDILDNYFRSENLSTKIILTHRVWYKIIPSIYDYIKFYSCTIYITKIK